MFPTGTRIGYSVATGPTAADSFGLRFTNTIMDNVFIARYSAPLSKVAFWVRYIVGTPQRSAFTLSLYQDGGDLNNPGTLIESISGGTGTISAGRLEFSGFSANLVAGRRYRLRLTTSNNVDNNYPEISLGQPIDTGDFNESIYCYDLMSVRWSGSVTNYNRANMQVFQNVGGQDVSDDVLLTDVVGYIPSYQGIGVRFTAPNGPTLRYLGLVVNRISSTDASAAHGYWYVKKGSDIVGVTAANPGFISTSVPDSSPTWGLWLYRFTRPLELEGGQTYDFIFDIAGLHNSSYYANFLRTGIDPAYVPSWIQRYVLLTGTSYTPVNNSILPTFFLMLDDAQPLPDSSGIINPYVMMPVG